LSLKAKHADVDGALRCLEMTPNLTCTIPALALCMRFKYEIRGVLQHRRMNSKRVHGAPKPAVVAGDEALSQPLN
jgi:hypothetical protein